MQYLRIYGMMGGEQSRYDRSHAAHAHRRAGCYETQLPHLVKVDSTHLSHGLRHLIELCVPVGLWQ